MVTCHIAAVQQLCQSAFNDMYENTYPLKLSDSETRHKFSCVVTGVVCELCQSQYMAWHESARHVNYIYIKDKTKSTHTHTKQKHNLYINT